MMALTPKRLFLSFCLSSCLSLFSAFFLALTIGSINIFWKCVWAPKSCFQPWRIYRGVLRCESCPGCSQATADVCQCSYMYVEGSRTPCSSVIDLAAKLAMIVSTTKLGLIRSIVATWRTDERAGTTTAYRQLRFEPVDSLGHGEISLNILTKSRDYSNWADRTIKQTHSRPCCVSVPSIKEMVLKHPDPKAVHISTELTEPSSIPF